MLKHKTLCVWCMVFTRVLALSQTYGQVCNIKNETSQFLGVLVNKFGENGQLTKSQFQNLWEHLRSSYHENHVLLEEVNVKNSHLELILNKSSDTDEHPDHRHQVYCFEQKYGYDFASHFHEMVRPKSWARHSNTWAIYRQDKSRYSVYIKPKYFDKTCLTVDDVYELYDDGNGITSQILPQAILALVYIIVNGACTIEEIHGTKPSSGQVWGYGIGFVTLVCVISNVGGLLAPIMEKEFFQKLLTFLVAMAVGTLAATGLLVLLPEAFDIMSCEELADDYLWKAATAMCGIYVFYISERILKLLFYKPKKIHSPQSMDVKQPLAPELIEHGHSHLPPNMNAEIESGERRVSTVAWMVLIGDALHNFVDGLSIGAAFTENIFTGVSVSIAVVCEELPHELGDVAILLHSGLSMKKALLYNFLSAVICYIGLIIGILLGENTSANRWIFAIAGGLFLYVSLVDMLPELSHTADEFQRQKANPWKIMSLQIIGLLFGFAIILVVAFYAGQIVINE